MTNARRAIIRTSVAGIAAGLLAGSAKAATSTPFSGALDVTSYGAVGDGKNDDSAAIAAACNDAMAHFAAGYSCYLKFPSGNFYINQTKLPTFTCPIGIVGAGAHQTVITIGTGYYGDVFSWSNCWMADAYGATTMVRQLYAGASVQDISFVGNMSSAGTINVLAFYNINDFARVQNVDFTYIPGRAIYCGASNDRDGFGILRESRFNEIRIFRSGTATCPCIEISSCGTSDGTNELIFSEIDIFFPGGHAFVIHNNGTEPVRLIKIFGLRIERVGSGFNGLQIGGPTYAGSVYGINAIGLELICCAAGSTALALLGSGSNQVSESYFQGMILNCLGTGVLVNNGYGNKIVLLVNASAVGINLSGTKFPLYYDCSHTQNGEKFSIANGCQVLSPSYAPFTSS